MLSHLIAVDDSVLYVLNLHHLLSFAVFYDFFFFLIFLSNTTSTITPI